MWVDSPCNARGIVQFEDQCEEDEWENIPIFFSREALYEHYSPLGATPDDSKNWWVAEIDIEECVP